ncbi:uncharacterized protein SPPG_08246 [Spizellomyces punctatus DAOM BR117]|uniref:Solute carrier family 25 member 44 n=1 Tax=Spizellomyces punctatus (strain DAOM BR117) TaxID=645134 RepID=A0A0L0H4B6_SPIPD|nr:uncharacterized protein SPPG_08246 [Spizellomyces punctatus DAOM BR117]KNC96345.1 hypothetical protein SPPG_08246 [Spizellomyces punctatus DAOM BR117]|eukprot:XP_016604385.1 hypothetical protein SPPG_08246 [Spizellomyces punctatus DAOM BR117]
MGDSRPTDISWDRLDKPRFFAWGTVCFLAVRSLTYPVSLVKTRVQVGNKRQRFQSIKMLSKIVRLEGVRALYQGFTVTALGTLPGQMIYLSAMESTKLVVSTTCRKMLGWDENRTALVSGLLGGGVASLSTQIVMVPVDVVSQRLMIQKRHHHKMDVPSSTSTSHPSPPLTTGRALFLHILQTEGPRGLYKGFLTSILTYAPSSAIWWGTQSLCKSVLGPLVPDRNAAFVAVSAASGLVAGFVAASFTTPLDVIKTRIQTVTPSHRSELDLLTNTCRTLWQTQGWKGFTRGMGARMVNMGMTSVLMIVTYETVKKLSYRETQA